MPLAALKTMAFGELAGPITVGATSIALATGEGTRFPAPAAGEYAYAEIIDLNETKYARFEIISYTGVSGDTLTGVTRGLLGTSASAFPMTAGNASNLVKVSVGHNVQQLREFVHGQGAKNATAAVTLAYDSPEIIKYSGLAGNVTQALPTTGVWEGRRFTFVNDDASFTVALQASGGGAILTLPVGMSCQLVALKDAPALATDWRQVPKYLTGAQLAALAKVDIGAGATFTVAGDVTQDIAGGAAPSTPAAGHVGIKAVSTDAFSVAKSALRIINESGSAWEWGGGASARIISGCGVDIGASYSSATGTAGADNTAQTVISRTIKADALKGIGRRLRITVGLTGSSASVIVPMLKLNGNIICFNTNVTQTLPPYGVAILSYVDATHANLHQVVNSTSTTGGYFGVGFTPNMAGFNFAADQTLEITQSAVAGTHITVYEILVEVLG